MLPEELWEKLELEGTIRSTKVAKALRAVKREDFLPFDYKKFAYMDLPAPIGLDQTMSAPHMVALMTSLLKVVPGHKILEIGTGSGYQTAVLLQLLKGKGMVYSVERLQGLFEFSSKNLLTQKFRNYKLVHADGSKGLPAFKPFDRIIVTASASKMPQELLDQLAINGLLIIPVGNELYSVKRTGKNKFDKKIEEFVSFVPLIED